MFGYFEIVLYWYLVNCILILDELKNIILFIVIVFLFVYLKVNFNYVILSDI